MEMTSVPSFLLSHSRSASSLSVQELASGASSLDPYGGSKREGPPTALITMSWEGAWAKSHMGLLGYPSGQRMPWDGTWLAWVDEWALEAKGQHPNLRLRGSWLRHGGWATSCCRRPETGRDPDPLRTCG